MMPESVVTSDIGRYAMVPEWLLDLYISPQAIRLYAVLAAKYADRDTGEAYPSRRRLADNLHVSTDTIDRALRELTDCGAVTVERRPDEPGDWETNLYTVRYMRPGSRTDAARGGGTVAARGSRTDAALSRITSDPESDDPERYTPRKRFEMPRGTPDLPEPERLRMVSMQRALFARLGITVEAFWGHDLIRRGLTESDIEHAITRSVGKGSAYVEKIMRGRVEERERGNDPDAGAGGGTGTQGGPGGRGRGAGATRGGGDYRGPSGVGGLRRGAPGSDGRPDANTGWRGFVTGGPPPTEAGSAAAGA